MRENIRMHYIGRVNKSTNEHQIIRQESFDKMFRAGADLPEHGKYNDQTKVNKVVAHLNVINDVLEQEYLYYPRYRDEAEGINMNAISEEYHYLFDTAEELPTEPADPPVE